MQRFFKENFALAAGIALPLILVALFLLAGRLGQDMTPEPKYDALFATQYGGNSEDSDFHMDVVGGKLVIRKKPLVVDEPVKSATPPRLFVFSHKTKYATPVQIDFSRVKGGLVADPALDELNKAKIDIANVSPDGYHFEYNDRSEETIFSALFGGYDSHTYYVLRKGPKKIPIRGTEPFTQTYFLGWIEP
jgi:hypothetical protein